VSLLMPDEIHELHLQSEESCCKNYGILFRSFPIQDRGVPSSRKLFIDLLNELREALESGKNVAIHCRQSIGRSSLVAASLLVLSGKEPDQAFNCIGKIRGRTVPDVPEQSEWVEKFADSLTNEHRDGKSKRSSASKSAFR
ncbi:MAG: dual specificity protein phosphatase family protein, partial [Deltaproteobacteria bacterium]|nr:dual specificity protein phosphatase family protein [Deltaproteobacteria bacterium]